MEAEIGINAFASQGGLGPPETGRGRKGSSPGPPGGHGPADTLILYL